ncbi:hypothetical protein BURK2_03421 [Burkholderiales bacterium]|nr:hypothetical protein BURK2_03421 [Burkholderiales bacterium]
MAVESSASFTLSGWRQRWWRTRPLDPPRVELRHSRIYILPSRRGVAFAVTLLAMLIAALNYRTSLAMLLVFLFTGAMAAALLHTFRNLSGLALRQGPSPRGHAGGDLAFVLSLESHGRMTRASIVLRVDQHRVITTCAEVPQGQSAVVSLLVPAVRRGPLPLGRITVSSDYPLGLWRAWAYVHFDWSGLAFPRPETVPPPLPANAGRGDQSGTGPGSEDFAGLRKYVPGDPLPHVAWKHLARGQGWLTKQFSGGAGGECRLCLADLPATLNHEARLSRLAAWAIRAERAGVRYALELPTASLPLGNGPGQLDRVQTALALSPPLPSGAAGARQ